MSNFRTTADILDGVLRRCGEMTSDIGTSPLQSAALLYLNQAHETIICGGNELNTDIDESWIWAKARRPIVVNLNPPITSGSVTLTLGGTAGTFSAVPQVNAANISVEGWYLKPDNGPEVYKIGTHTSGQTAFTLDAAFPQASYHSTFRLFQLDYEILPSYIVIDKYNDIVSFKETSAGSVFTGVVAHGTYTPDDLATAVAAALNSATTHGNTYGCTYDSILRLFRVLSDLSGSGTPIFNIIGNAPDYYRSTWDTLGFDFLTTSGSSSYQGTYPLGATARLFQAARCYYGYQFGYGAESGQINNMDPIAFDREYPLIDIRTGTPQYFTVVQEKSLDGKLVVRMNKYPAQAMRVEFEHVAYPRDLQNNAQSIPKVPRRWIRILEYMASYMLSADKTSDKAQLWLSTGQNMLKAMMKANRTELQKTGKNFGAVIARPDLMPEKSYRRLNDYGYALGDE